MFTLLSTYKCEWHAFSIGDSCQNRNNSNFGCSCRQHFPRWISESKPRSALIGVHLRRYKIGPASVDNPSHFVDHRISGPLGPMYARGPRQGWSWEVSQTTVSEKTSESFKKQMPEMLLVGSPEYRKWFGKSTLGGRITTRTLFTTVSDLFWKWKLRNYKWFSELLYNSGNQ